MEKALPRYLEQTNLLREVHFIRQEWQRRNESMADNIEAYAKKHRCKRVVVVVGAEHRHLLCDLLRNRSGLTLKEFWELQ